MNQGDHEVLYRLWDGTTASITLGEAGSLLPEEFEPFRTPPSYRRQRHMPGLYWSSSSRGHVIYESRLELRALTRFDFDPVVKLMVAQPFALLWEEEERRKLHVPDYLVVRSAGPNLVVDVKPARRASEPKTKRVLQATREMCGEAGWDYEVFTGEDESALMTNIGWLSGFRRPTLLFDVVSPDALRVVGDDGATIGEVVNGSPVPVLTRPAVYHMLWWRDLSTDLSTTLSDESVVRVTKEAKDRGER